MIETPLALTTILSATEPATLPPWAAAMSTITLPDRMLATISSVISSGAGLPGIRAVVMMMSTSFACSAYICAARRLKSSDISRA
jgi:hypothetical protein